MARLATNGHANGAWNGHANPRDSGFRETFENIHLDLSKSYGKCRFADAGLAWKAAGEKDTWTLDKDQLINAHWSRASRGYELKIFSRSAGVIQLDGFLSEVHHT
jgi:structure-specific recognition protein 1